MRASKTTFPLILLLGMATALVEHRVIARQEAAAAAHRARLAALAAEVRAARQAYAQTHRDLDAAEHDIAKTREELAIAEAGSKLKLWGNRITLLKRLLDEMPGQAIPELRLLTPVDWVQVVRALELDSTHNLRRAMSGLRALARQKFGATLMQALKRFTADSGGKLPGDIEQLAPYLNAPADPEMLARYAMTRSGPVGAGDKYVIKENPTSDLILWAGVDAMSLEINSSWQETTGEGNAAQMERTGAIIAGLATAFGGEQDLGYLENIQEIYAPWFKELLASAAFYPDPAKQAAWESAAEVEIGTAVDRFLAAHASEPLTHLFQVLPYLETETAAALAQSVRPMVAYIDYVSDYHEPPKNPTQLERYLNAPFDQARVLRAIDINLKDGRYSGFSFSIPGK